jgi:hypothetical protein
MPDLQSLVKRTHVIYKNHKPAVHVIKLLQTMIALQDATDETIVNIIHRSGIQDKYSQFIFNLLLLCHRPDSLPNQMTVSEYSSHLIPAAASSVLPEHDNKYIREVELYIRHKKQANEISRLTSLLHDANRNLQLKEEEISQKNVAIATYDTIIKYNESIERLNKLCAAQEIEMNKLTPLKAALRDKIHSCAIATSFGNISLDETVSGGFQTDLEVSDTNLKKADEALIERTSYIQSVTGLLNTIESQYKIIENQITEERGKCNPLKNLEEQSQNQKILSAESRHNIVMKKVEMDLIHLQKALSSTKELLQTLEQANNKVRNTIADLTKDLLSSYQFMLRRMESRNSLKKSDVNEKTASITIPDSDQTHADGVATLYSTSNSASSTPKTVPQPRELVSTLVTHAIESVNMEESLAITPTAQANGLIESNASNNAMATSKRRNYHKNRRQTWSERAEQKNSGDREHQAHHQHSSSNPQDASGHQMLSLSNNSSSPQQSSRRFSMGVLSSQHRNSFYSPIVLANNSGNSSPNNTNHQHMRSGSDQQNYHQKKNNGRAHPLHHSISSPSDMTLIDSQHVVTKSHTPRQ